jgi:hypothetical protein
MFILSRTLFFNTKKMGRFKLIFSMSQRVCDVPGTIVYHYSLIWTHRGNLFNSFWNSEIKKCEKLKHLIILPSQLNTTLSVNKEVVSFKVGLLLLSFPKP